MVVIKVDPLELLVKAGLVPKNGAVADNLFSANGIVSQSGVFAFPGGNGLRVLDGTVLQQKFFTDSRQFPVKSVRNMGLAPGTWDRLRGERVLHISLYGEGCSIYLTGIRPVKCPPNCCLVALDNSENSWMTLKRAGVLAAACGDRLKKIVEVNVLDVSAYSLQLAGGHEEIDIDSTILDRAEELLLAQGVAGDRIIKRQTFGDPADVLVDEVKEQGAELIFMGRRDRGAVKELFMGSVSSRLIHHCREQTIVMFG